MFRTGMLLTALVAISAAGLAVPSRAQTTVDVSAITCEQFLSFRVADPQQIAIWLSGYYHGLKQDTKLDVQTLQKNYDRLKSECFAKPKATLVQVIETLK